MDIQSQLKEGINPECFNMFKIAFPLAKQGNIEFGYIAKKNKVTAKHNYCMDFN